MNAPAAERFRDPALVDFGVDGGEARRLEILGGILVDRPLQQPGLPRRRSAHWAGAAAIYRADPAGTGHWTFTGPLPDPWRVAIPLAGNVLQLEVRPAPSGQGGIFLEQVPQWRWLAEVTPPAARMLSLFAHSGGATLALAAAGAAVVHVDSSRQATTMARRNAAASGLDAAAVRWVCEDARAVVARELRRGARYDGAVLDPPSWGHGPKGQAFAVNRDLVPLLADVAALVAPAPGTEPVGPILLTCHSPGWHHRRLHDTLSAALQRPETASGRIESGGLACTDAAGRDLQLGGFARWHPAARRTDELASRSPWEKDP